jgi:hypothetical protein
VGCRYRRSTGSGGDTGAGAWNGNVEEEVHMAKTKFSINKKTLVEERRDGNILTRVPNSNMEYYMLIGEDEVLSEDESTLIVEWDSDTELDMLPRIWDENAQDGVRRPSLEEAVVARQNPEGSIKMKASELYDEYYEYDKNKDPEEIEKKQRIREQKRQAALKRSDETKKMTETAKPSKDNTKGKQTGRNTTASGNGKAGQKGQPEASEEKAEQQDIPQSPAEKLEQQRQQMKRYTKEQFKEIRRGVSQKLDTSQYRDIEFNPKQMRELRLALKAGMDVSKFNSPFISAEHMRELRIGNKNGVRLDLEKLDQSLYNAEQIHELRLGFEKKLDMKNYLNPSYSAEQMRELRLGQQAGFNTKDYEDVHLTAAQMHSIRQRMVLNNLGETLKKMCEDIRQWLSEKIEQITEMLRARYQGREVMTPEQIRDARVEEAVQDIEETLVQSELLPESAYKDKELDSQIKGHVQELAAYAERNPEQKLEQPVKEVAEELCEVAGIELNNQQEDNVISISRGREVNAAAVNQEKALQAVGISQKKAERQAEGEKIYNQPKEQPVNVSQSREVKASSSNQQKVLETVSSSQSKAIEEAVERVMQEAYEMDEEMVMEEETWEMIQ